MGITDVFKSKQDPQTLADKMALDEELQVDLSIAEKRVLLKKLNEQGLGKSDFGGSWKRIVKWLKEH